MAVAIFVFGNNRVPGKPVGDCRLRVFSDVTRQAGVGPADQCLAQELSHHHHDPGPHPHPQLRGSNHDGLDQKKHPGGLLRT